MKRRDFIACLALITAIRAARAQQPANPHRIAVVSSALPVADMSETGASTPYRAFFKRLRQLGYVEGQNLVVERYSGEGKAAHYPDLAGEVARRNPNVIIAFTNNLVLDFQAATRTIPIVGSFADPVGLGIVASLARPGGNITGTSVDIGPEQWSKRYQLLKEVAPRVSNVGLLATRVARETFDTAIREAFSVAGFALVGPPLDPPVTEAEYRRVFAVLAQEGADGLVVDDEGVHLPNQQLIADLAEKGGLPAIYPFREFVEAGGLMSYGMDFSELGHHMADAVDQILRGSRPGEIPIYQPTKFELIINLKTATALGLTIPPSLLARADEVIE